MLAYEETGKYVSERHAQAKAKGKLTAGQVAKILRKRGLQIKAKELKRYANEWHHSGFYKDSSGLKMGRTYFFPADIDFDILIERIENDRIIGEQIDEEKNRTAYIFKVGFRKGYGRRKWIPIAKFITKVVPENGMIPDEISLEDYEALKRFEGEELEPYETFAHFRERMVGRKDIN